MVVASLRRQKKVCKRKNCVWGTGKNPWHNKACEDKGILLGRAWSTGRKEKVVSSRKKKANGASNKCKGKGRSWAMHGGITGGDSMEEREQWQAKGGREGRKGVVV